MRSNYKPIGDYVKQVKVKNTDNTLTVDNLRGIRINKEFMPSVANVNGTDLSKYKVVERNQFAYNPMHVGRDEVLPISLLTDEDKIIVSPAYVIFEIEKPDELLSEYLMMWCRREEFDRNAWFTTDNSVRGGFNWEDFCAMKLPVPSPEKQKEIVKEYHSITDRIKLNESLNQKLEDTAQSIYKEWFINFEFPDENGKPYKSNGGEMVYCDDLEREIPKKWILKNIGKLADLVTKGTTPKEMYEHNTLNRVPYIKCQSISDNHFLNKSKLMYIDIKTQETLKRSIIIENDLLFSITGTLGEFALATKEFVPANTNQNVAIIRIKKTEIPVNFVYWLFLCNWQEKFLQENRQEAVQANLNLEMIKNIQIMIPDEKVFRILMNKINPIILHKYLLNKNNNLLLDLKEILLSKMATIED